jgi:outer membrane lipoprotein-sorting protein
MTTLGLRLARTVSCIAIVIAITSAAAVAQQPDLVKRIRETYRIGAGMTLQFDLEIYWAIREKTEKKSGKVQLADGDKFRARVGNTVFVSDGVTYWQYNEGSNQAVIKDLLDVDLSMHPSQLISEYLTQRDYTVKEHNGNQAILVWQAPQSDAPAGEQSITAVVDTNNNLIKKLTVVDKTGNTSAYTFTKIKLDSAIAPETFTFIVPQGANVLDTRK